MVVCVVAIGEWTPAKDKFRLCAPFGEREALRLLRVFPPIFPGLGSEGKPYPDPDVDQLFPSELPNELPNEFAVVGVSMFWP